MLFVFLMVVVVFIPSIILLLFIIVYVCVCLCHHCCYSNGISIAINTTNGTILFLFDDLFPSFTGYVLGNKHPFLKLGYYLSIK